MTTNPPSGSPELDRWFRDMKNPNSDLSKTRRKEKPDCLSLTLLFILIVVLISNLI